MRRPGCGEGTPGLPECTQARCGAGHGGGDGTAQSRPTGADIRWQAQGLRDEWEQLAEQEDEDEQGQKAYYPRMPRLFEWGLLQAGERVYVQSHPESEAEVLSSRHVMYQGRQLFFNEWGMQVTGWRGFNVYESVVHKGTGRTLHDLRMAKWEELGKPELRQA